MLVSLFGTAVTTTWHFSQALGAAEFARVTEAAEVRMLIDDLQEAVSDLHNELKDDRYTLTYASEIALREAIENPGHKTIDPRNPTQVFQVLNGVVTP